MNKILVPIDFSANSLNALRFATAVAADTKADVILFHSYHITITAGMHAPPIEYIEALTEEKEREVSQSLDEVMGAQSAEYSDGSGKVKFFKRSLHGIVVDAIDHLLHSGEFDLMVMGTKGASGFKEILWGSITAHVIEKTPIPVLVIPEKATYRGFKNMVYATNFDDEDVHIVEDLRKISDGFGATLTCLHVNSHQNKLAKAQGHLKELASHDWAAPTDCLKFELVEDENTEKGLSAYLASPGADLVAVLPQTRGFIEDLFHNSLTKRMALHTETPLLVMR